MNDPTSRAHAIVQSQGGARAGHPWDESQHPRQPAGTSEGGEFAPSIDSVYASAMDNELATVAGMKKFRKLPFEEQHGIARVRVFAYADVYAEQFGVDAQALRRQVVGNDNPRDWTYWRKEAKRYV